MFDQAPRDNDIRRVMDACLPGLENRPDFDRDVLRHVRGEIKVKKKLSVGFVLVVVLVLMFATVTFAITLNLFDRYGQKDPRLTEIAPHAVITPVVSSIKNEDMGLSTVTITNAYYDGSALLVGYTIENPEHIDYFTPTKEQLAQMKPDSSGFKFHKSNEKEKKLEDEYTQAQLNNAPFGVSRFKVYLSMDTYSDQGVNLGTWTEFNEYSDQNLYSSIRDFDTLPKEVCGLESLSIRIPIYQSRCFFYYDGENAYTMEEQIEMSPIAVTIALTEKALCHYNGNAVYSGIDMHCIVEATDVRLSAELSVQGELPVLPDGYYYDMCLKDVDGSFIEASSSEFHDNNSIVFTFRGIGTMPNLQTAYLFIVGDESGTNTVDFNLTRQHDK